MSEIHNLLTSVGGKHAEECFSLDTSMSGREEEEEGRDEGQELLPGGFTMELSDEENEEEIDQGKEGVGREEVVKSKPNAKLAKVTSGSLITGDNYRFVWYESLQMTFEKCSTRGMS